LPLITIPYAPRDAFKAFHNRQERWSELICHRRAGKTVAAINDLQKRCLTLQLPPNQAVNPPRFAFMAPTRVRAKDIAWQYLKRFSQPIPGIKVSESELFVEYPNGGRVTVYGADNDRGMGLYLDGVVFDECDEIPPSVDDVVMPALSDRKGWTVHMGILRGRHNLFKRFEKYRGAPGHFQLMLRASETGIIDPDELASLKDHMGAAAYAMQMEADVNASMANAIYGQDMDQLRRENRLRMVPLDRGCSLYTFWDIGYSDYTTIWLVQFSGRDILLLDYLCFAGQPAAYYAAKIRQWEVEYGQVVRTCYVPHDAQSHDKGSGKTYVDHLIEAGLERVKVVPRTPDLWSTVDRMRKLFPRLYINAPKCSIGWTLGEMDMPSGIDCLDYYSKREDATSGFIKDEPVHDQYSHGASALHTLAEAHDKGMIEGASFTAKETRTKPVTVLRGPGPDSYSIKPKKAFGLRVLR
jgi:phage terminase large subunit